MYGVDALVRIPSVWSDLFFRFDKHDLYKIVEVFNFPPTRETVQSRVGRKLIFMNDRGSRIKEKVFEVGTGGRM